MVTRLIYSQCKSRFLVAGVVAVEFVEYLVLLTNDLVYEKAEQLENGFLS